MDINKIRKVAGLKPLEESAGVPARFNFHSMTAEELTQILQKNYPTTVVTKIEEYFGKYESGCAYDVMLTDISKEGGDDGREHPMRVYVQFDQDGELYADF